MSKIEFKNLKKHYELAPVIHNFNIEIENGEFVVLVGPSGCGKSTLLRTLAGLETITEGELLIDGVVVNKMEPKARGIGFVFQDYALYPHFTVRQNMSFALENSKVSKKEITSRVSEAAESLRLSPLLDRYPRELSGGQQQRVALGRALVRRPKVFLMDEPLSNLDAKLRFEMRRLIKIIQKKYGITTLYVTHDQEEAMAMGDRIVVLNKGVAQQIASPFELFKSPANKFVAGFIGLPAMSFLTVNVTQEKGGLLLNAKNINIPIELEKHKTIIQPYVGKPLHLGIRSNSVQHNQKEGGHLKGSIELIEIMGAESLVFITCGENSFSVRIPSESIASTKDAMGDEISLDIIEEKIHLFDTETEACLI